MRTHQMSSGFRRAARKTSSLLPFERTATCEALSARVLLFGGDLDTSFSGDGMTTLPASFGEVSARDVAVQADGKVLVIGESFGGQTTGKMVVSRFNANGSLDTTFGSGGVSANDFLDYDDQLRHVHTSAIAVQADGGIVVVGWGNHGSAPFTSGVIERLTASGALDSTFSGDGKDLLDTFDGSSLGNFFEDVKIQADGKIVVGGAAIPNREAQTSTLAMARYNANGMLDSSFDGNGHRYIDLGDNQLGGAISIGPDGKIVIVGDRYPSSNANAKRFAIARINTNGSLDSSFDGDGLLTTTWSSAYTYASARDVVVQSDRKILIVGEVGTSDFATHNFGVMRLNTNGSRDTTFGTSNGQFEYDFDGTGVRDVANSLLIGKAGKILVGGASNGNMAVFCLSADGAFDNRFAGDGTLSIDFPTNAQAMGMALAPNGTVVAAGTGQMATARFFDRSEASVSIATFQPVMNEQGATSVGLIVARLERLTTPTRVYFNVSGTATRPNATIIGNPNDYTGDGNITFANSFNPNTYVDIPANSTFTSFTLTAVDDARVEGDETAIFSVKPDQAYDVFTPTSQQFIVRDNDVVAGPSVTSKQFLYETAPQTVRFVFDQNVGTSLTLSDFVINGPGGMPTPGFNYNATTNTAELTFASTLPDGDYTVTLPAGRVTNSAGTPNPAATTLGFFTLGGDADHDHQVGFSDLIILAQNYGELNRIYSLGDFNYDRKVDFNDLVILAQHYGKSALTITELPPMQRAKRIAEQVL